MIVEEKIKGDVQVLIEELQALQKVEVKYIGDGDNKLPFLVSRNRNAQIEHECLQQELDGFQERPRRREGEAELHDLDSFVEHTNRFKCEHSTVWANESSASLRAILNYHEKGSSGRPGRGDHVGCYAVEHSRQWKDWVQGAGRELSQAEFAEFMETHLTDVANVEPENPVLEPLQSLEMHVATPLELFRLSKGMRVHVASEIHSAQNLSSGEAEIQFKMEHRDSAGGKLKVPGALVVRIPVFHREEPVLVAFFLRYRVQGSRISWILEPFQHRNALEAAFQAICNSVAERTELPVLMGRAETE